MIKLTEVSKNAGKTNLLEKFSFSFKGGKIYILEDDHGKGAQALLGLMGGLLKPDEGSVEFADPGYVAGYAPLLPVFEPGITLESQLLEYLFYKKIPSEEARPLIDRTLKEVSLGVDLSQTPDKLAPGQLQILNVVIAFLGNPSVVLLNEPFSFVSAEAQKILVRFIKDYVAKHGPDCVVVVASSKSETTQLLGGEKIVIKQ